MMNNDINTFIRNFDYVKSNDYKFTVMKLKIEGKEVKSTYYSGINLNNKNDCIIVKEIRITTKNEEERKQLIKEIFLSLILKGQEYFPNNIEWKLSKNNEYIYSINKDNSIPLNYVIQFNKQNYLEQPGFIKWVIYQICFGIHTLHSNQIIHHDIKPSNISINEKSGISISDLSNSIFFGENSLKINLPYAAPELLIDDYKIDEKIDMWSLGILMLELYNKKEQILKNENNNTSKEQLNYMFSILSNEKYTYEKIETLLKDSKSFKFTIKESLLNKINDSDAIDLIKHLLVINPQERYSAEQALESKYLSEFTGLDSLNSKHNNYLNEYQQILKTSNSLNFVDMLQNLINYKTN